MKIGMLSHMFPTKRHPHSGIFVKETVDRLVSHVDVEIIAPLPNFRWFGEERSGSDSRGYNVKRPFVLAFPRFFYQRLYPESMAAAIARYIDDGVHAWDVVHAHAAFPDGVAAVKAVRGRKPVVLTVHGSGINVFAHKPALRSSIGDALRRTDAIVCVSADLQRSIRELNVDTFTKVIPNGVNTDIFKPLQHDEACNDTGLSPDRPRVIFIGNMVPIKGLPNLIEAMRSVVREIPDCELVMIGGAPGRKTLHEYNCMIADAGIERSVLMKTRLPHGELPRWICASDVLALPSIREGFGLVAAESLSCGRPVVATRSGGPESIVGEGEGILVPVGDSEALAEALVSALHGGQFHSPEELSRSAGERFSYDNVIRQLLDLYSYVSTGS